MQINNNDIFRKTEYEIPFKKYIRCELCVYANFERDQERKPGKNYIRCDKYNQWTKILQTCKASKLREEVQNKNVHKG